MRLIARLDAGIRKTTGDIDGHRLVGLRFFWLDGLFASLSDNFIAGFLELFLLSYGVTNRVIGFNSAFANLCGAFAIIPGAMAISRMGSRKRLIIATGGGIGRVGLLAIALLPFLPIGPGAAVTSLIGLNALRTAMGNFANPAWTSLVADLVPQALRARYFGNRNVIIILASIVAAPIGGAVVKSFSGLSFAPQLGFQLIFALAFAAGILSTLSFSRIPDVHASLPSRAKGFPLRALLADKRFVGLAISAFIWNMSLQVSAPFFNVYLVGTLGASPALVGLLAAVASITTLLGQIIFGKITDRKGDIFVQMTTGLLIPLLPLSWLLVTAPEQVLFINVFTGLLWAGYNLASFNILLKLTPDERRPEAVALYQTLVMASSVIGPLIGGALADAAGYKAVFMASGAGRIAGILFFIFLVVRPGPLSDRPGSAKGPA